MAAWHYYGFREGLFLRSPEVQIHRTARTPRYETTSHRKCKFKGEEEQSKFMGTFLKLLSDNFELSQ